MRLGKALSVDLRERVVEAGPSRRAAAERFGVGVSSTIRFVQRSRERGDHTPDMGRRAGQALPGLFGLDMVSLAAQSVALGGGAGGISQESRDATADAEGRGIGGLW